MKFQKIPGKKFQNIEFILIAELPEEQRVLFSDFVRNRPHPQFFDNIFPNKDCAYYKDYEEWLSNLKTD